MLGPWRRPRVTARGSLPPTTLSRDAPGRRSPPPAAARPGELSTAWHSGETQAGLQRGIARLGQRQPRGPPSPQSEGRRLTTYLGPGLLVRRSRVRAPDPVADPDLQQTLRVRARSWPPRSRRAAPTHALQDAGLELQTIQRWRRKPRSPSARRERVQLGGTRAG